MGQDILEIIRLQRMLKAYSQEYVANQIKLTQSHYAKIENGRCVLTFSIFIKLIEILELEPNQVLPAIYNKPIHELNKIEIGLLAIKNQIIEELENKLRKNENHV